MEYHLPFFVMLATLGLTFSSPLNPFTTGDVRFERVQEEQTCFVHVKIQQCQEAGNIQLRLEGTDTVLLQGLDLDVSKAGNEQDMCLPVPCQDGILTRLMKLVATSEVGRSLNIVVSPERLGANFQRFQQESVRCLGNSKKPADVIVTCKEQKLEPFDKEEAMRFSLQTIGAETDGYNNEYDGKLDFSCGDYQVLNSIESRHSNTYEDRQYKLGCTSVDSDFPLICYWTPDLNDYDEAFIYTCAENFVMAGIQSEHDNVKEDRIWRFRCCSDYNYVTESCVATDYLNDFNQNFTFHADDGVFIGAHSYHDNCHEDRRWSIIHCKYVKKESVLL